MFFRNCQYEFHPQCVFKGHKDAVSGFVFPPNEEYIVTASKDNFLIYQPYSNACFPFEKCNKAALSFDIDDFVVFRSEFQTKKNEESKPILDPLFFSEPANNRKPERKLLVYNS